MANTYTNVDGYDYKPLIITELNKMKQIELNNKQPFKVRAYKIVIDNIQKMDNPIFSMDDLNDVSGIGNGIKKKIKEIIETGKLKNTEKLTNQPHSTA